MKTSVSPRSDRNRVTARSFAQHVADAADRKDRILATCGSQLLAQTTDVDIDEVGRWFKLISPYAFDQHCAGQHCAGVPHEFCEKL